MIHSFNQQNPDIYQSLISNIPQNIHLTSNVIPSNLQINIKNTYTKNGINRMIPLSWNILDNASSYALFCIDLHQIAKNKSGVPWVHLYIPHIQQKNSYQQSNLNKNRNQNNNKSAIIGKNSFGNRGYDGPQPPPNSGKHKYVFYLLALHNVTISKDEENKCRDLQSFIENIVQDKNKILGYGILPFTYEYKK